jgi:hypothetical protein
VPFPTESGTRPFSPYGHTHFATRLTRDSVNGYDLFT